MRFLSASIVAALALAAARAAAEPENFDSTAPGALPAGWKAGVTGTGKARWATVADASAPSAPNALLQSGQVPSHCYPWCVKKKLSVQDGFAEVKFKPLAGREDQAGGLIWRWQDGGDYYVARGNALEDNIIIFRTVHGVRKELHRVPMKVAGCQWHTLRVDFAGSHFTITFDGQKAMDWDDDTFKTAGAAGVWTKADSIILFDDFQCEAR